MPEVVITDRDEDAPESETARVRQQTTRPPPPMADAPRRSEARLKRGEVSETSIAELIAELMIDLSPGSSSPTPTREAKRPAPSSRGKKEKLPRAVVDEVVADRKKDPRSDD